MKHLRWIVIVLVLVSASSLGADPVRLAEEPSLPDTVMPLEATQAAELLPLIDAAERFRGLALLTPLSAGRQAQDAARETLASLLAEEITPEEADVIERMLRILGLWNIDRPLTDVLLDVLSSEIAGYYDPEKNFLALVEGVGDDLDLGEVGEAMAERMAGSIWVHEIGHALQDQHFDLEALGGTEEELLSDRSLARESLVEGDASLVMFSYVMGTALERFPEVDDLVASFASDPAEMASMAASGSADALAKAPSYLQEVLIFPYLRGLTFCLAVRRAGGQNLLDHLFRHDPPTSTEQILHPEKWLEVRDDPVEMTLPDLGPLLGGRSELASDDLGELTTSIVLRERLGKAGRDRAERAAAGWGGDIVALYGWTDDEPNRADPGDVFVWISEWDDEAEAAELAAAAADAFGEDDWTLAHQGTRVVLAFGLDEDHREDVIAALLAAPAKRHPVRPVDLAALGITDADRPKALGMDEIFGMMDDPVIQAAIGSELGQDAADFADLLGTLAEEPEVMALFESAGSILAGGGDLGELLENLDFQALGSLPGVQALREKILNRQEPVAVTVNEEGVVRLGQTGFSLALPTDGAWLTADELGLALEPEAGSVAPAFQATEQGSEVYVVLVHVTLPMPARLEALTLAAQAEDLGDAEILAAGYLDLDGVRAWQREMIVPDGEGGRSHAFQRIYLLDRDVVTVLVAGPAKRWKRRSAMAEATLAGVRIGGPTPADSPE